jgi:2-oxoglutarate ferredoxin oxidoreductase subunit alpha
MKFLGSKRRKSPTTLCKTILIGGEAGEGIKSAGKIIAASLLKKSYNVFVYDEYPSLIRGGHNIVAVTYSKFPVYSTEKLIDILICLNRETFDKHKSNLKQGAIVIHDEEDFEITSQDLEQYSFEAVEIPGLRIIKTNSLHKITLNIINISAGLCVAGIEKDIIKEVIAEEFKDKPQLLASNFKAMDEGYENAKEYFNIKDNSKISEKLPPNSKNRFLLSGNEALSFGAIKSGLQFYAAYPMTPASTILDFMIAHQRDFNIAVKQAEDEIAAINMTIGAGFAGARAMVGTSGGGFSLMVEGLGLAAITETPITIILSQRPGPATGMPTWTGQSDLLFVLNASQDEFPRIILTPTDIEECFEFAFLALNLADKYQVPVFVLIDKYLSESLSILELDKSKKYKINRGLLLSSRVLDRIDNYQRFELTPNGISPRSIPGQENGIFLANSDESDTKGFTTEEADMRISKVEKRMKKLSGVREDLPQIDYYGDFKSKLGFITWGSPKGAILEAMRRLQSIGVHSKLLALNYVEPFAKEEVEKFIKTTNQIAIIETNHSSQLGKLITMNTGFEIQKKFLKYDGRPIFPEEIMDFINTNFKI